MDSQQILLIMGGFAGGIVAAVVAGQVLGFNLLGKAKREAAQTISNAEREAATIIKESSATLKERQIELRQELENETRAQRKEIVALENRMLKKEEVIEKRAEGLDERSKELDVKERELKKLDESLNSERAKVKEIIAEQLTRLEQIAGLSTQDAREEIFKQLEHDVKRDTAVRLKRIEDEMVANSDKKAKWVIAQAVQRYAGDHIAESTVSSVALPNDEMKGRIIGREGRNIRALESATGINVIIDDTPEAVILSGFDPVRREIARQSLEKLIVDGRIHPARIEEVVEKTTEEMNQTLRDLGEQACIEVDVHGLHPELVKLLGRLHYRTSYGQNVLQHSKEVCHLAGMMAAELGLKVPLAKRAGLLHDIGKAINHEVEGSHAVIGHDLTKRHGEDIVVSLAAGSHHGDMPQTDVISVLVQAADALSAARPGARRETIENYIKRLEDLERIATGFEGVDSAFALQAGREIRVIVHPDKVSDAEAQVLARDVARQVENELVYPGQINVVVVREIRAMETAK